MATDPIRFTLMAADRVDMPDDPQTLVIDLMAVLRDTVTDAMTLRDSIVNGVPNSRSVTRSVEVFEGVARALDIAEQLAPACRRRGLFTVERGD